MRIDIHTHFVCLDFVKHMQGRSTLPRTILEDGTYVVTCGPEYRVPTVPKIVDMDVKLKDMEETKVDVSVLSHGIPGPEALGGREADEWATRINDYLAGIIEKYPGKFIGLGSLGFGDPERTIAEADRCVHGLGFRGFQLFSNVNGRVLDSRELMPVYKHIAGLGVPLNMHPTLPLNLTGMETSGLVIPLAFLYDTTLNTMRLIQSGLFDEAPGLTLIVPHIGGVIPYLRGRIEAFNAPSLHFQDQPTLSHPMRHYLNRLYVDTVCYHIEALEYCYRLLGAERLLYGTDHPFGPYQIPAGLVEQLECSDGDRELIYHGNAERLLNLK